MIREKQWNHIAKKTKVIPYCLLEFGLQCRVFRFYLSFLYCVAKNQEKELPLPQTYGFRYYILHFIVQSAFYFFKKIQYLSFYSRH